MASKVTNEDIIRINSLYYKYKVYAQVARETGFAPSTVKKYIIKDWTPVEPKEIKRFDLSSLPEFDASSFRGIENYGELCVLTERELEELEDLWEELAI